MRSNEWHLVGTQLKQGVNERFTYNFLARTASGSHHIFVHPKVRELVNLQEVRGKAKPYQVGQFLQLVEKYNLRMEDEK